MNIPDNINKVLVNKSSFLFSVIVSLTVKIYSSNFLSVGARVSDQLQVINYTPNIEKILLKDVKSYTQAPYLSFDM